ncbi:hypothetical protein CLOM_g12239 [Closterium sp. NIES-68]|nr:hypothetical protein CLOM_g12239 [Closterium sp. NIES-68]GJP63859.1 hypothetical protein CLOP_g20895 [Closterium sp. NIES-67]
MPHPCLSLASPHAANCTRASPFLSRPLQTPSPACLCRPLPHARGGGCTLRPSSDRAPSSNGRGTRSVRGEIQPSSRNSSSSSNSRGSGSGSGGGGGGGVGAKAPSKDGTPAATAANARPPRGGLPPPPTIADIEATAAARGVRLEIETTGPLFTISAYDATGAFDDRRDGRDGREGQGARTSAEREGSGGSSGIGKGDKRGGKPRLLGRAQGCIRPLLWGSSSSSSSSSSGSGSSGSGSKSLLPPPLLHLDSVRMARIEDERQRGVFGAALLIGALVFRWAMDVHGCRVAQLLAIDDTDEYHAKLVRYYSRLGMRPVREVEGGSLGDIPHMLVWGGAGTLMEGEIEPLLRRWARVFPPAAAPAAAAAAAAAAGAGSSAGRDAAID